MNRPEPTPAPVAADVQDGLASPQRLMAFSTLAMAIAMAVLDGSIVTVALPAMARQFAVAPESAIWIVNAFQLAVTVSLLPLAALGDIVGYRRVYWWGLAVFTVASLACALAPTFAVLTLARLVQGLGAAGIMSVNIALIRFIYPHSRLGQGVGNMAVVVAVASAASPSVASAILSVASWHWLFLVNVPIGALALVMAAQTLPATPRSARRLDLISVVLNALAFGLFIAGVNRIGQGGACRRRSSKSPSARRSAWSWSSGSSSCRRRCCRSISCAGRCSRCLWRRRSRRSERKAWPWWRCRSISRTRLAAPPPPPAFS